MGVIVREKPRGSGVYWMFIHHHGKRTSKRVGSKAAAEKVAEQVQARLTLGKDYLPEQKAPLPTLKDFYDRLRQTYLKISVKESTLESYETSFKVHILPDLGHLSLDEVTRPRVKQFIGVLADKRYGKEKTPLSRATIWMVLKELCSVLNHAKEDGHIDVNPAEKLGRFYPQTAVTNKEIQPLTAEEVGRLFKAVLERSPQHYPLLLCAIHTGMRSGELEALQWGDIDWEGKFITVRRNRYRGRVTSTKNDRIRRVDMSDALLEALHQHKKAKREQWLEKGSNVIPEWVFANREGNPADMANLKTRHFFKCLARAKLRRIRFHDLRHTYASLLIQNGESLAYVRDQLGHSTIKLTVDIYGHLVPGANRQAVNKLPTVIDAPAEALEKAGNE